MCKILMYTMNMKKLALWLWKEHESLSIFAQKFLCYRNLIKKMKNPVLINLKTGFFDRLSVPIIRNALLILAMTYLSSKRIASIFGAEGLNFCVRDGNRCDPFASITRNI